MKNLIPLSFCLSFFVRPGRRMFLRDSGVFLLHKFEQHIGKETYKVYNYKDQKSMWSILSLWIGAAPFH
jgi:hypothetical protein